MTQGRPNALRANTLRASAAHAAVATTAPQCSRTAVTRLLEPRTMSAAEFFAPGNVGTIEAAMHVRAR